MNILHLYDKNDAQAAHYVAVLMQATGGRAAMHSASTPEALRKSLAEGQAPDIIHLHGAPRAASALPCRYVLTPHGQQPPAAFPSPFVVIARSKMEQRALDCQRCEVVLNPIITRSTTPEACARQMLAIYRRVLQSDVLPLMSDATRRALQLLLAAAVSNDRRWLGDSGRRAEETLQQADFQQLYIYTHHEGVQSLLQRGLGVLGYKAPPMEPFASYLPEGYTQPAPMTDADIPSLLADLKANGPSLLRLCELAQALRSDDLDEAMLLRRLDEQRLTPFMASVLQLLAEQTMLTEGFMPCQPADNALTAQLRQQLQQRQHIC